MVAHAPRSRGRAPAPPWGRSRSRAGWGRGAPRASPRRAAAAPAMPQGQCRVISANCGCCLINTPHLQLHQRAGQQAEGATHLGVVRRPNIERAGGVALLGAGHQPRLWKCRVFSASGDHVIINMMQRERGRCAGWRARVTANAQTPPRPVFVHGGGEGGRNRCAPWLRSPPAPPGSPPWRTSGPRSGPPLPPRRWCWRPTPAPAHTPAHMMRGRVG
jgi:hypothetical protein